MSLFFLFFLATSSFAEIRQWDFDNPEDYQFDQNQIKIKDGKASLIPVAPYRDAGAQSFQRGQFDLNTTVDRGTLELSLRGPQETAGPELPSPVGNREPGLAALWHLDEPNGTNLLDSVGRTVAKASDAEVVSGQTGFGYARLFDGEKSFVFIPHYETLSLRGPFSIETWIRPLAVKSSKPQTIVSRWQTVGAQRGFALQINTEGKLDFLVSADGATVTHQLGNTVLSDGVWQHVTAVYTGSDLRIYVNGILDSAPLAFSGPVYFADNPVYLGALVDNRVDQFYQGVIDEVAIYQRPLTETETLTHFGNIQGLAGLWHLNERGGVLADASGYGQNGNVSGDVRYETEGRMGTGLGFSGHNAYAQIAGSSRLAPQGQITLEAWIKPEVFPGLGRRASVLSIYEEPAPGGAPGGGEISLSVLGPDGRIAAYASKLQPAEVRGRISLTPGVWQHVAVTWSEGRVQIYNNGIRDTSSAYTGSLDFVSKAAMRLGTDASGTSAFQGSIDEVAVYRRARTGSEIAASAGLFAPSGIFTSEVKDAGGVSPWKTVEWKLPLDYGLANNGQEAGLLHLFHLDDREGSGITNSKGEIQASPIGTYPVPGIFGQARWFAGKGYDKILSQKDFPALSTFSISCWFEFASGQAGLSDRIFSIGDGNPTVFRAGDGRMHVQMQGAREIIGDRILGDSRWHHLALTADGRNLFLYIDGLLDGVSPFMTASAQSPLVLGNLKSTDTFQGAIDEFLFYNYPLDRDTVLQQFLRGQMDAKMLVRSSDSKDFSSAAWRGPQGVKLEEEPAMFTSALWHFDEKVFRGQPGEIQDAGHFANHGTVFGKISSFSDSISGSAVRFNGSTDFIRVTDTDSLHPDKFTISAWVRPDEMAEGQVTLIDKQFKAGAPVFSSFALDLIAGNRLALRLGRPGGYRQIETGRDGEVAAGKWNHVAAVFDRKEVRLYINGKKVKTADFREPVPYDDGPLYFGRYASSEARYFRGALDEVHLMNTPATDAEIESRFAQADPGNFFRPSVETPAGVSPARYFQYRVFLSTRQPFASPAVSEVNLRGSSFPAGRPAVSPRSGISYAEISSFTDKKGAGNAGHVTYQISPDGSNWFFHNGRRWVVAAGSNESNTSDQIQTQVNSFAKEVGMGSFYFRAFLQSPTGMEPAEIEDVEVEYLPNKVTVTSPNGGEALLTGTSQVIRWNTAGEMKKVSIEYSKDGFHNDFHEIAKGIDNTGSFEWKVPDDLSTSVKVRVMDSLDPRIYDMSDISFRVTGKFELITPNSEERWMAGSPQKIVWRTQGKIPEVKLDYSTDGFEKTVFPIVDSVKNEGSFEWKVPDHLSKFVKVRVSDVRDPEVFDKSNDSFSITGGLGILSPQLGTRWITGSQQEIRWQSVGTIPLVNIEYFTSGRGDWVRIAENFESRGSFMWQVPDDIDGQVQIRVIDASDLRVSAESEPFAIVGGLRLLNPKGGEQWTAGTRRKIAWETIGSIPAVNLEYKSGADTAWQTIEKNTANTGSYVWEVPASLNGALTVRVVDARDPFTEAVHASASSVIPGFHLQAPNGGEEWKIGTEQQIIWETTGESSQVRLEYSKDGFKSDIHEIIAAASNLGSFTWTVPDDASQNVWIRVSDSNNSTAQSSSNASFRIYGGFEIQIPKGGEKFEVGSQATFVWDTLGTLPNVRLEYSHDDFAKDSRLIEASAPNEGRYTWTVPDDIGDGYRLRISDTRDPKTEAYSKEPFAVMGNFHLIYPVGGEDLIAGTVARIAWRGAGSVPVVRIDYSEDDFQKSFNTITDKAPNNGAYDWTVPNLIGRQFKIRVWDPSQPDSVDVMKQSARIVGGFRLMEPNGGEVLYVGDRSMIKWETSGTLPRVKLELSTDNFTRDISVIADSYPNNGQYDWLVPDAPSGRYKVRVSDPRDVTAFDISNADFLIRSRFTLQSPNGGEGWAVGEKKDIRWQTSAAVSQVRLDFTTNDFQSVSVIDKLAPNTGLYEWTVPDQVSENVRLRVSDTKDPEAFDVSDAPFRIQGIFHLTSPNGGEVWKTGEQRAITWQTTGQIEGVRLEYSRDGFSSESRVIVESTPNTGHFNWTVPDDVSAQVKVKVMDVKNLEVQDASDQNFEIVGSFVVLAPNGGESWHATEKREITWMTVGTVKDISIDYSGDDFKTYETIEHGLMNTGRYTWDVPDRLGENFKVRICDTDNPHGCDFSDNVFAVRSPLEITAPRGGEEWLVGSNQEIRWNTYGSVRRVAVSYASKPGNWIKLIDELPNEGHFLFRVPDDISREVLFKVTDYDNEVLSSVSRGPLAILGSFDLITPDGGQKWAAGTTQKISWDTLGAVSNARLEYSFDDFKNDINLIESSIPNTGSYEWKVPAKTGLTAKVRIADANHTEAFDTSKEVFKIMPGMTVISPNGGEQWTAGHKEKITWKTEGKSDWVRIEYSTGSKPAVVPEGLIGPLPAPVSEWKVITDRAPNGGYYEWEVPTQNGTEYKIRVVDALDSDAVDESDNFFEVKPEILLNHPVGKENFRVGEQAEILWDTVGTIPFVKVEYSLDGFNKDIRPIADKLANEGKLLWTVPDTITDNAKIRVSSSDDALVRAVSPAPFKILPPFEILVPTGIEKWTVGTEQTLKWDWRGTVETVKLEYSVNDFSSSTVLIPAAPNKGFFVWTVPDLAHAQVSLKVSDPRYPEASAVSKPFKIIPGFKMTAPAGGEKFDTGSRQNIEWQTAGLSTKVKLEYGVVRDGVTVWKTIENVIRNSGRYEWKVPDDLSSQVKVRVSDVLDSAAFAENEGTFKILGVFKLLSPRADELLRINDRFQIRWETQGKVPSVKIEYTDAPERADAYKPVENLWQNNGNYFWTVPDTASEKVWLKISDAAEPDAFRLSEAPFKIRGSLAWDMPVEAGGLNWPVGSQQTLKWVTVGTLPRVNLEYTTDQKTWKTIASGVSNAGSFGWTVPDDTSRNVLLRISDPDLPVISDVTERPLTISAEFKMLSPSAGDVWTVGSSRKIEWKTTGHVQKIWLQFMADGKKWQQLAGPLPDGGFYEWTVPDHISSEVKIRILDGDNDKAFAESSPFKITGTLTLQTPAGGEVWETASRHEIRWAASGSISKVRLEAVEEPLNAGDAVQPAVIIAESVNNKGSFEWAVPDRISDRLKVRVTDASDASVSSQSANPFSIIAHLEVKNPKRGDIWTVGSDHEIVWTVSGTVPTVRLEYSRDDFYRETNLIASDAPNTGAAMWTVPDAIYDALKVRVSDSRDIRAFGLSEPFKVRGEFAFVKPEPGQVWRVGSLQSVEWQTKGTIPSVRMEFSRDDFQRDIQVISNVHENTGRFEWAVPDVISRTLKLRILDEKDASVLAVSNPLKVEGGLALKSPMGGEKFQVLSTQKIAWDTTGSISKVRAEYSKDDFNNDVHLIASDLKNEGSFDWLVPDDVADTLKVRVMDAGDFSVNSISPASFAVRGSLLMTTASAGQRWAVGSEREISWETVGTIPFVTVQYSKDDFQKDIRLIAENAVNRGKINWTVSDDISTTVRLRIFDAAHGEISATAADPLSIVGALNWTSVTPGTSGVVGEPLLLKWNSQGTIPVVRLEYGQQTGSGAEDWKLVTGSLENKGEFSWVVPDFITDRAVLKISDARDAGTSAVSPAFKISGKLTMGLPSGGERWIVGTSHDLVWNTSGSVRSVALEYSSDGFRKDIQQVTSAPITNTGRYLWTVPDRISDKVQIRVKDAGSQALESVSGVFSIAGDLAFLNPSGTVSWQLEVPQTIEWQTVGSIPFVRLEAISADGGEGGESGSVLAARIENTGKFTWNIPDHAPARVKLRVVNADDSAVFAETPEPVQIFGVLNFTAPAEKQVWTVGSTQDIAWTTRGFAPNVKLEFSRDGFRKDIQIIYPLIPNNGSVQWQVPDVITPELWLRVSDADHPRVSAVTSQPVAVKGALEITAPVDSAPAEVGEKQEIVWKTIGSIPFVRVEYSADGFTATQQVIAEKVPNTGRFTWDIPAAARQKLSVRVSDDADPGVFSVSRPFGVHGKLELLSPRGGEIWKVDETAVIQWNTLGNVEFVKIEYSSDEFITSDLITARAENKGSFAWRVPTSANQPVKIRVSDADDPAVSAVTATPLKVQGVFEFLAPQGGEFWISGTEQPVIWQTRGSIPYASLEYSTDNFNTAIPVMLGFVNEGRVKWTVPDTASDTLKFRVTDARDQSVFAVSAPVRVGGRLQLLSPSGELLRVGQETSIRWKTTGVIPKVRLEYSGDAFKQDVQVLQDSVDNLSEQGEFTWKVPDMISKDLQVRVSDIQHSDIYDVSAVPFKIAGTLRMTAPRAGETWPVAGRRTLEWETSGTIPFVRLEYSANNFVTAVPMDLRLVNTGRFDWTVPDLSGQEIQFRISDADDSAVSDMTPFRVAVRGILTLTSPLGDEVWQARSEHPVTWTTTGTVPNVSLEYVSGLSPVPVKIAEAIANTGSYVWKVPDQTLRSVKVRVSDSRNPMIYSESPVFETRGSLSLNAPQGGEIWIAGTEHPVLWTSTGSIEKVRLEYSIDQFNTVTPVSLSLPNEGRYQWRVPDAISRNAQIRVSDAAQPEVRAESRTFEIRGALTLINPIGGEDWAVGSRHPVSWETTGTIPQVKVEYSSDDFRNDIQLVTPATANKGVYYWDIPSLQATQIKVRVVDTANPDVFDISRNPVRIAGDLELITPSNGETYRVGEKIQVRWRATPNIANVKLEYSADDFKTAVLISNYVPNTGTFDWNIPDRLSENLRVRISDAANAIVSDTSKIPFRIQGAFKLTSPLGDQVWTVGSRQKISWNTLGSVAKVRLEYSSDNFKTAIPIAAGLDNQGSFDWSVPELGQDIQIKVSDASVSAVQAVTDGKIHVVGRLELITPAAGERWIVGEERVIRWRVLGLMPKVDLEYSKDGFSRDIHLIAENVPNFGSYAWKIPNDPADKVTVRIRSAGDHKVFDVSEAPFRIDYNHVSWTVRDLRTGEHLVGLTLTDSTGKTRSGLSSPLSLDYPYGIYTTVWSKPGYGEFQSTWLADKDMGFMVSLNPEEKTPETVRFDFRYDADRDLMSIRSWYELDGAAVSSVVKSEVKIYQGTEMIKTLISTTPDTNGIFSMVWDTRQVAGNTRYVASASITTADGRTLASPVSYQLDIPVKEFKEPAPRQSVASVYLKPLALPASGPAKPPVAAPVSVKPQVQSVSKPAISEKQETSAPISAEPLSVLQRASEFKLSAPSEAVINETVSIAFTGDRGARPVLDIYDANRRLILRAQPMTMQPDGQFVYLLPVKGYSFIPGKSVTVTAVDLTSQQFKSVSIMIKSAASALGLDRQAGMISAQELVSRLDDIIRDIQVFQKSRTEWEKMLPRIENGISNLAGSLTRPDLPDAVISKVNDLSQALAGLLESRGYSSSFLADSHVAEGAPAREMESQLRLFQDAIQMLRRLYDSTVSN